MIKRIMHAEGDSLTLVHECAVYLKDSLHVISMYFKDGTTEEEEKVQQYIVNMPTLNYVFEESVKRYYSHKDLKKLYKNSIGEEENEQ